MLHREYDIAKNDSDFQSYLYDLTFGNYLTYKDFDKYANGSKRDYLPTNIYIDLIQNISNRINADSGKSARTKKTMHPFGKDRSFNFIFTEYGPCTAYHSELATYFNPK